MKTRTKVWLIIAGSFVLLGGLLFSGIMTLVDWNFSMLSTNEAQTNEYVFDEKFENIDVSINTADIEFIESTADAVKVVCVEESDEKHTVKIENNTLSINYNITKDLYQYIGINFNSPKILVYIPAGEYGALTIDSDTGDVDIPSIFSFSSIDITATTADIKNYASSKGDVNIKTSTGSISLDNVSVKSLDLTVTTGSINVSNASVDLGGRRKIKKGKSELYNVTCKSIITKGSTGDLTLTNVEASEKYNITRSTGDVTFDSSDAKEINIETDTGDVKGTLLSDKIYIINTNTGDVYVPKTTTGGVCEITTSTGDINIKVNK